MPAEIRELEEHEMPKPMLLTKEERQKTRTLYQTVFLEDSQKFVDFYYEYKIRDNQIYALWEDEQYVSMVHLNPYTMIVNGYEVFVQLYCGSGNIEELSAQRIYAIVVGDGTSTDGSG